ncbi:MAG: VWA domain-containing protein [Terracidiphilus sp.]
MFRRGVLGLLLAGAVSCFAAKPVTVDQLEQILTASKSTPDASLASQILALQLTQRVSTDRLTRLNAQLPGQASRQALQILADTSQFEPLPTFDIPTQAPPSLDQQRSIMALVIAYVSKTIPQLPNFFATRRTSQFEETPQLILTSGVIPYQPLHFVSASAETVLYRDGHEIVQPGASRVNASALATAGLTTKGAFGPILGIVLLDAAQSTLAWSHWEPGAAGNEAVFHFAVPKEKSHYAVDYCCIANPSSAGVGNRYGYQTPVAATSPFHRITAYHGEFAVDPKTGSILRIMIQAELKPTEPIVQAGTIVWYGTVEIGGTQYLCPTRSISMTRAQSVQVDPIYQAPLALQQQPLKTALSDTSFEGYHVFRSNARILTPEEASTVPPPVPPTGTNPAPDNTIAPPATPSPANSNPVPALAEAAAPSPTIPPANPTAPSAHEDTPEMQFAPTDTLPGTVANAASSNSGFTLHTSARLVNIEVIALDKKGKPVTGLASSDFALNDNGRPQTIRFFSSPPSSSSAQPAPTPAPTQPMSFSNQPSAARLTQSAQNSTILLIDSSNLAWGDFSNVRRQMLTFFKTLPAPEPVGVYVLNSHGFQVLAEPTTDHALIQRTLTAWIPDAGSLAHAQDEERRNLQQFDFVHSIYDLTAVNGNANRPAESYTSGANDAGLYSSPTDPQLMSLGSSPGRDSLLFLELIARHLAAVPGHKNLVWVTSNNVLADNLSQAAARQEQGPGHIDSLAASVQEPLNDAHVSLYPLDASQLESAAIGADVGTRNVLAIGFSDRDAATAVVGDAASGQAPGRDTARLQQDVKPIQGLFRDLASATGGRALRRASDIAGELDGIVRSDDAAYLLSFTPDTQPDNRYHTLSLTVPDRKGIHLQYRTGYLYQKQPDTIRDQFRQALWSAADVTDLPLHATPAADAQGLLLKVIVGPGELSPVPGGNRWNDFLDIFLVTRDEVRRQAQVQGERIALHLRDETWQKVQQQGLAFDQRLDAPPATGTLRIIAIDERSGKLGTLTIPAASLAHLANTASSPTP